MNKRNRQRGMGQGRRQGFGKNQFNAGPGGNCLCPKCNYSEAHSQGTPCREKKCPQCGSVMIRE